MSLFFLKTPFITNPPHNITYSFIDKWLKQFVFHQKAKDRIMQNTPLKEKTPFWLDPDKRAILYQACTFLMVGLLAYYLISNTIVNLEKQSISSGFGFLTREAAFEIGESTIAYSAADTYGRALLVGALNTLKVSFIGIVLSLIIGVLIGVARLSSNWLFLFFCNCFSGMHCFTKAFHLQDRR